MTNFESFPWNISSSINLLVLKSTCVHCTYLNYEIIFSAHLSVLECVHYILVSLTTTNGSKKSSHIWNMLREIDKKNVPHFHTLVRSFFTFLQDNEFKWRERVSPILRNAYNCNFSSTPETQSSPLFRNKIGP